MSGAVKGIRSSIRRQIYLSFAMILTILLLIGALGFFSVQRLADNFSELERIDRQAADIQQLDRSVIVLRNNVQAYIFTGHEGITDRVRENIATVEQDLDRVSAATDDATGLDLLTRMRGHLETYKQTFEQAREERALGKELLDRRVVQLQRRINAALADAAASGALGEHDRRQVAERFSIAERNLYAYQVDPDYQLLQAGRNALSDAKLLLDQRGLAAAVALFGQFEQVFIRLVQATRAYLYLTGVVMAAESQEFAHVSSSLREHALASLAPLRDDVSQIARLTLTITGAGTLLAMLLGIALSTLLARWTSRPLIDITRTFTRLAAGEAHPAQIPHAERPDEIGELAAAASVFKQRNEETTRLLDNARQLTTELEGRKKDLTETNQQLEEFVYTVSHDLKSPIVTSLNFIGVMRRLASKDQPEQALEKLDVLERAVRSMQALVDDLLNLSRIGRVETETSEIDVNEMLDGLRADLADEIEAENAVVDIAASLPPVVASATRVRQVFSNLIRNALKYGHGGDGCRIEIGGDAHADGVEYFVRDYGPGIAPEYHQRVFGLFQRLENARQGTGVGLSIVERVMRLHGGTIRIESQGCGDGAKFLLWFPRTRD